MSTDERGELVATKLRPPTLPARPVPRPRLDERLDGALADGCRLVLVSAPAGAGKSTAVALWLDRRPEPAAWLQVEAGDADPARFWAHLVASLDRVVPGVTATVQPAVASSAGDADALLPPLVNALADAGPVLVVLDDFHLVDNPSVLQGVERLVELAPPSSTVVLLTRTDPPFRLGRLRVGRALAEIRVGDLRFASDEAGELLGGGVDPAVADRLCERTEGWAAGLVLAGLSLAESGDQDAFVAGFGGDDRLIVDYLGDEMLATVDTAERRRLLETSILDQLSASLVDAICGTETGDAWLHDLAARNQLVIGLDRTGTWFRYHHLLRDLLRLEAERSMPERLPALHRAAAGWHHEHGDIDAAVDHYISAGELSTAGDLIAEYATLLLNGGQIFTVLHQLDRLGDLAEHHSGAALVRGWTELVTGRLSSAARWFEIAREHDDGRDVGIITALGVMIRVAQGDVAGGADLAAAAPPPSESTQAVALGAVWTWAGRPERARPFLDLAAELAAAEPSDFSASVGGAFDALAALESGATTVAAERAAAALDHAAEAGVSQTPQLALAHAVLARTTADEDRAVGAAERAIGLTRLSSDHTLSAWVLATAGDVLLDHGDRAGEELLREARASVDRASDPGIAGSHLARIESRHAIAATPPSDASLVEPLTDRELAVLRHLPTSLSQREIAGELYVSLNTVKTHCRGVYRKLGVTDRKAAVQRARELDLL